MLSSKSTYQLHKNDTFGVNARRDYIHYHRRGLGAIPGAGLCQLGVIAAHVK